MKQIKNEGYYVDWNTFLKKEMQYLTRIRLNKYY